MTLSLFKGGFEMSSFRNRGEGRERKNLCHHQTLCLFHDTKILTPKTIKGRANVEQRQEGKGVAGRRREKKGDHQVKLDDLENMNEAGRGRGKAKEI